MGEQLSLLKRINRKRQAMYEAFEKGVSSKELYKLSCEMDKLIVEYMRKYQQSPRHDLVEAV
ncbi:aspartyl-phosphate phosphatase Spo0E family protein [Heliorestis acidaminivorans]|uniref:Aspartyl-phosphate phosphatase Spo0E family protein n=1 Tax=Heliorestis acidaminivorans TaxID=553427 RepID=A0A6I0ERA6_9FIRM|nr:aspartyl-phosphate phosphatase Spo0E family protein [Heliorestis acidaminivorans]KAB2952016.1 aspartyl-phosphate phosphatase Spo0E family protein [Heliorestis acidaminivorans]